MPHRTMCSYLERDNGEERGKRGTRGKEGEGQRGARKKREDRNTESQYLCISMGLFPTL